MASGTPSAPSPRGNLQRFLIVPALLTALALPLTALAWVAGDTDLLYTALFWEVLMWAGAILFLAGKSFEGLPRAPTP